MATENKVNAKKEKQTPEEIFNSLSEVRTVSVKGKKFHYRVWRGAKLPKTPPVVLFLHGYGESGNNNTVYVGIAKALHLQPERWPFLVVIPQKPDFELWPNHLALLKAICEDVNLRDDPDQSRIYLTGLSQGGHGTFHCFDQLPWKFAAIAPICGWGEPMEIAKRIGDQPCWIFHGSFDPVVPASCSQAIFDVMQRFREKPFAHHRFTNYFGVDHNSWDFAYQSELPQWFLTHQSAKPAKKKAESGKHNKK